MKKNIYQIMILNNQFHFNKSIKVNSYLLYLIGVIIVSLLCLSCFSIYKIFYPHPKQNEFNILYNRQKDTLKLINELIINNSIDSLILKKYNLKAYVDNENKLIPNNLPVDGIVTKGINKKTSHNGIDIAAKFNNDIYAAQKGLIIFSDSLNNLGRTIIISHPNNYYTLYAHLNKTYVKQREYIRIDKPIGTIGQSGNSDGPHLHFEIWKNNTIIDPRDIINNYKLNDVSIK